MNNNNNSNERIITSMTEFDFCDFCELFCKKSKHFRMFTKKLLQEYESGNIRAMLVGCWSQIYVKCFPNLFFSELLNFLKLTFHKILFNILKIISEK